MLPSTAQRIRVHARGQLRRPVQVRCQVAVGIDLGTSNSAVAIVRKGCRPEVLRLENGSHTIPSIVTVAGDGTFAVGEAARQQAITNPSNTFSSVKRLLGRRWEEVADMAPLLPYQLQPGAGGAVQLQCPALGRCLEPEEVSAEILRHLLLQVQQQTGQPVRQAVITVPAYFTEHQRECTIRAGTMAGLLRVSLLQEPVAASLAHGFGLDPQSADIILVADLGGGTFDVSLLDGFEGILEVLETDGDAALGGDDFDRALAELVLAPPLPLSTASAIRSDAGCVSELVGSVQAARIQLSSQQEATVNIPAPGCSESVESVTVTRHQFERQVAPLMRRVWLPLERLAADTWTEYVARPVFSHEPELVASSSSSSSSSSSNHTSSINSMNGSSPPGAASDKWAPPPRRVTGLVLVGGASQTPVFRQMMQRITGLEPRAGVDPSTSVALGAAIQAGVMTGVLEEGPELMDGSYMMALHSRASGFQF